MTPKRAATDTALLSAPVAFALRRWPRDMVTDGEARRTLQAASSLGSRVADPSDVLTLHSYQRREPLQRHAPSGRSRRRAERSRSRLTADARARRGPRRGQRVLFARAARRATGFRTSELVAAGAFRSSCQARRSVVMRPPRPLAGGARLSPERIHSVLFSRQTEKKRAHVDDARRRKGARPSPGVCSHVVARVRIDMSVSPMVPCSGSNMWSSWGVPRRLCVFTVLHVAQYSNSSSR